MPPLHVSDANGYDKENNVREKEDFINPMNIRKNMLNKVILLTKVGTYPPMKNFEEFFTSPLMK